MCRTVLLGAMQTVRSRLIRFYRLRIVHGLASKGPVTHLSLRAAPDLGGYGGGNALRIRKTPNCKTGR
jgi:hypothetical protein